MVFREDGFLESSESSRIAAIRQRHAPWFTFLDKLNRLAMTVLFREVPKVNEEVYAATLYARAVTMFQGAVRLAERGLAAESRTLVRGCAETAIALGCVRRDKSFLDRLDEDHDKHRMALANELLGLPEDDPNIPAEQRANLRRLITEIAARYKPPRPLRINWSQVAIIAKMTDLYMTVYRETSSDSAHVSLKALERHVEADASGSITRFRFQPEIEGVADTLSQAIAALLHATEAKLLGAGDAAADEQVLALTREWSGLVSSQAPASA